MYKYAGLFGGRILLVGFLLDFVTIYASQLLYTILYGLVC